MGFRDITERPKVLYREKIDWKAEATIVNISDEEYNNKIEELSQYPTLRFELLSKWRLCTNRSIFEHFAFINDKCWCNSDRTHTIYLCEHIDTGYKWYRYCAKSCTGKLDETGIGGTKSFEQVTSNVKLSYVKGRAEKDIIDTCCEVNGQPIIYSRQNIMMPLYKGVCKADFSSAYPSNTFDIPTMSGFEIVDGYVEPDHIYPFSFFSNGCLALLETDGTIIRTTDIVFNKLNIDYSKLLKSDDSPKTLRLKRSNNNDLYDYYSSLYEKKNSAKGTSAYNDIKSVLNSSLGYMRSYQYNRWRYCGYISAVVYLRHLNNMIKQLNTIDGTILSVLTDSIIWQGNNIGLDRESKLGKFVLEEENAICMIRETGQYVFLNADKTLRKETLHNMGYDDEIKQYINTIQDFEKMSSISYKHHIKSNVRTFNKFTRRYI